MRKTSQFLGTHSATQPRAGVMWEPGSGFGKERQSDVRLGSPGQEKLGIVDQEGKIRDLY